MIVMRDLPVWKKILMKHLSRLLSDIWVLLNLCLSLLLLLSYPTDFFVSPGQHHRDPRVCNHYRDPDSIAE